MSANSAARTLLNLAKKDLTALRGMADREVFSEEIFGFHVQQAAEKALKAWIASLGVNYPSTHNLAGLIAVLEGTGVDVSALWTLVDYNAFGVMFRYDEVPSADEPLDRESAIQEITGLLALAEAVVGS